MFGTALARGALSGANFEDCLGQLLDEQRNAVCLLNYALQDRLCQHMRRGYLHGKCRGLPMIQTGQRDQTYAGTTDPGRNEFGAERDHEQNGKFGDLAYQRIKQFQRARIGPMRVIEQHQYRAAYWPGMPADAVKRRMSDLYAAEN